MVSILTKGGLTARFSTRIQSIAQNDSTNVMLIIDNEDLNYDRQKNGQHGCSNRFFSVPIQVLPKSVKKDIRISSVQFSSVTQSCPTLCDPMNRSTPGLPVHQTYAKETTN